MSWRENYLNPRLDVKNNELNGAKKSFIHKLFILTYAIKM